MKCGLEKLSEVKRTPINIFLENCKKIHGDVYNYSKVKYTDGRCIISIICNKHGLFKQLASLHLSGSGCTKCGISKRSEYNTMSIEEFIKRSIEKHINKYNYSKVEYVNSKYKVIITCKKHGDFKQTPNEHLSGKGCPKCKMSKGEMCITSIFDNFGIEYIHQKRFDGCKRFTYLPFDFYLPKYNLCIEYDGKQHFTEVEYWGGKEGLEKRQLNDQIKTKFCKQKQINLLRLSYKDNIEEKLNKFYILN